jgi:putative ATPase
MLNQPLSERLRPRDFDSFIGQDHLIGKGCALRNIIETGNIPSMILWGPPGVGKTTLALIITNYLRRPFYSLSAINSGVKDVREIIEKSKEEQIFKPILFIDEIHRFSKSQQDSLLGAVEKGIITLIGATTENPSFEVISPLLSRCQVYILKPLGKDDLSKVIDNAFKSDELLKTKKINLKEYDALMRFSGGDARKLLNIIELVVDNSKSENIEITNKTVTDVINENISMYDKDGEMHYDIISAFIKSIRGSDPNAAVYWLARMIHAGEDVKFIARRMVILASEDIGLSNPNALLLANACFEAVNKIGHPEARIILSEAAIYLATSTKSNSAYMAIDAALAMVERTGNLPVPLHLRNAPTKLMKELNYGKDYKYAHSYSDNFVEQEFLPEKIKNHKFFEPQNNSKEIELRSLLSKLWKDKYGY